MGNKLQVISAAIAGMIIGGMTVVAANQVIQATQNEQIKISLNGIVQTFRDESTGELQYPLIYNNRTYLPLRNVAQLAGLKVDYDAQNNEAKLINVRTIEVPDEGEYDGEDDEEGEIPEEIDETEIPEDVLAINDLKPELVKVMGDAGWLKENVSMKVDCFGDPSKGMQELSYIILSEDMILIRAFAYDETFGTQVYLVTCKADGTIGVTPIAPEPAHPGHGGYSVDVEKKVVVETYASQGVMKYTAYKITDNKFVVEKTLDNLDSEDPNVDNLIDQFEADYNTEGIDELLTNINY